jgi:hypothetical protein
MAYQSGETKENRFLPNIRDNGEMDDFSQSAIGVVFLNRLAGRVF